MERILSGCRVTGRNAWCLIIAACLLIIFVYALRNSRILVFQALDNKAPPTKQRIGGGRYNLKIRLNSPTPRAGGKRIQQRFTTKPPLTTTSMKTTIVTTKSTTSVIATGIPRLVEYSNKELPAYQITALNTNGQKLKIYVHGPQDLISHQLIYQHTWEAGRLAQIDKVLRRDPGLHLIDIGCNLGVFTLAGAAMGRKVLALDANIENVKRVRKSVLANNFQDRVTIVYNALSDHHSTIQMGLVPSNIGGSIAIPSDSKVPVNSNYHKSDIKVPTLLMDDLLPVLKFKRCVIKMDIEGFEYFALRGSSKFFKSMDVPVILMEWSSVKLTEKHAKWVIQYFTSMGYVSCSDTLGQNKLTGSYTTWPGDINWVKLKKQK